MHGVGFEMKLQEWFEFRVPKPTVSAHYIADAIKSRPWNSPGSNSKVIWLGNTPTMKTTSQSKKGLIVEFLQLDFDTKEEHVKVNLPLDQGKWLVRQLEKLSVDNPKAVLYSELKASFESDLGDFEPFWFSKQMNKMREVGFIVV